MRKLFPSVSYLFTSNERTLSMVQIYTIIAIGFFLCFFILCLGERGVGHILWWGFLLVHSHLEPPESRPAQAQLEVSLIRHDLCAHIMLSSLPWAGGFSFLNRRRVQIKTAIELKCVGGKIFSSHVRNKVSFLHISVIKWCEEKKSKCKQNGPSKLGTTRKIEKIHIFKLAWRR